MLPAKTIQPPETTLNKTHRHHFPAPAIPRLLALLLAPLLAAPACAGDLTFGLLPSGLGAGTSAQLGPVQVDIKGATRIGEVVRVGNPSTALTSAANQMSTLNDGDLNYRNGDAISKAIETYLQGDFHADGLGLFVSAKAWRDQAMLKDGVPHGNSVDGYTPGAPLGETGFTAMGRATNAVVEDAYAYGRFAAGDGSVLVRIGDQVIPWVTPTTINGGLERINGVDYAALVRASSIAEETTLATPALYARWSPSAKLDVDAYSQFSFKPNVYPPCGTFYSTSDYAQPGCDVLTLNGALLSAISHQAIATTDQQSLASAIDHVDRAPDSVSSAAQFGASAHYLVEGLGQVGLYVANYTERTSLTQAVRQGPGVLVPAAANLGQAQPTGISSEFRRAFVGDIHLFGIDLRTRLGDGTALYTQLTYRPNQPISWNGTDFLNGLLAGVGPDAALATTPVGSVARGYDTFKTAQLNLGASRPLGNFLGGEFRLSGEAAVKTVYGLPDVTAFRYGRVGFGAAPSTAMPACMGTGVSCQESGYVTPVSWGVRAKIDATWRNAFVDGLDVTPALMFAADVRGYSYDMVFSQGRRVVSASLNAQYQHRYDLALSYVGQSGGTFNITSDRSLMMLSAGVRY